MDIGVSTLWSGSSLLALCMSGLVLFVPGAMVLIATRWWRSVDPLLLPATAAIASLALLSPWLILTIMLAAPLKLTTIGVAATTLLLAVYVGAGSMRQRHDDTAAERHRPSLTTWLTWLPPLPIAFALIGLILGYAVGETMSNDALYHAAQALKLSSVDHVTLASTGQFIDGGPHPGYLIPAWQALCAVTAQAASLIAPTSPVTVLWVLPAWVTLAAVSAAGGIMRRLLAVQSAAAFGALAWLLVWVVQTAPMSQGLTTGSHPRHIATELGFPVIIAALLAASDAVDRVQRRRGLGLLIMAAAVIVIVHVSYVVFLGFLAAGWLLVALLPNDVSRRHGVIASVALVGTAAIGVVALHPWLSTLDTFAAGKAAVDALDSIDAPANVGFGGLLLGSPDSYHLRTGYLAWHGALSVIGIALLPLVVFFRHRGAAWLMPIIGSVVVIIATSNHLYPLLVEAMGAGQAKRLFVINGEIAGLTMGGVVLTQMLVGTAGAATTRRRLLRAVLAAALLVITFFVLRRATGRIHMSPLPAHFTIPSWPLLCAPAGVLLAASFTALQRLRRAGTFTEDRGIAHARRFDLPATVIVGCVILAGCSIYQRPMEKLISSQVTTRASSAVRDDSLAVRRTRDGVTRPWLTNSVRNELAAVGTGAVVLAEPELSYELMAIAPVYVVGSVPGHTAATHANRILDRQHALDTFFDATTDRQRFSLLKQQHVDLLILEPQTAPAAIQFVRRYPACFDVHGSHGSLVTARIRTHESLDRCSAASTTSVLDRTSM